MVFPGENMSESTAAQQHRILLVEDDAILAMDESMLLKENGYRVTVAHKGLDAIERARVDPDISLILMDIDLGPGSDGTQTAAKILENRNLPIVFLTSHSERETVRRAKQISPYGYVLKSSGKFVLLEAITMAFELFAAHQRLAKRVEEDGSTEKAPGVIDQFQISEAEDHHYLKEELLQLLRRDQTLFDFLQAGSLDGIWYWDLESPENEWLSPRFWEALGYDPKEKSHDPAEWQGLIYEEDLQLALDNFDKHLADPNHPYDQIVRYRHKDGGTVWVRCRGLAIRDREGRPLRMLGAHNDITNLKETEYRLRTLLDEKATLVREIHHRVKNNLAMVSNLVYLKNEALGPEVDLSDLASQIQTMSSVYDKLVSSEDETIVDIKAFVQDLLESVFQGAPVRDCGVKIDGVSLPAQAAITFGLIVNELAVNAIKHGRYNGEQIGFSVDHTFAESVGNHVFHIANTGMPIPAEVTINNPKTHGLRLIRDLVQQLQGTVEIVRDPATFVVTIPAS
jgi:PAS domain S-box-containing protein